MQVKQATNAALNPCQTGLYRYISMCFLIKQTILKNRQEGCFWRFYFIKGLLGCEGCMAAQTTNYVTGDAAYAVNRRGVIMLWNTEAEKLFGFSAGEALGQRCWKLLAGEDIYHNRYCCEYCPLREMASRHESVHGSQMLFRTAYEGRKKFSLSYLEIFDQPGNGLLLHICHQPDEAPEVSENNHTASKISGNCQRGALTSREREVLELLADGKTTREIASMMCISHATVRNHVQHMLHKLHVHNRLEAVVKGQHLDLI
jgi:DNA-binding CsgD family transcriptional regulator